MEKAAYQKHTLTGFYMKHFNQYQEDKTLKTALMTELRKIRMEERSTPITDDDEVLVKN